MLVPRRADATTLPEALNLQMQRFPPAERASRIGNLLESSRRGELSLDQCFIIQERGKVIGVILAVVQSDGTIFVWPAETHRKLSPPNFARDVRALLYRQVCEIVDRPPAWIGQALLDDDQREVSREMQANGFPKLTNLLFMHRPLANPLPQSPGNVRLTSESLDEATNLDRFLSVLDATYIDTCDCAEVTVARRTAKDAFAAHKLTGSFDPVHWKIYQHNGVDVGILLLTVHYPELVWEVVYFGVGATHRGHGFGRAIVWDGMRQAQAGAGTEMVLAVDTRNTFAIALYDELGFTEFDRRIVHARFTKS